MKNSILGKARWLVTMLAGNGKTSLVPLSSNRETTEKQAARDQRESSARVAQAWLKYAAVIVMLFTIGSGNAWGADTNWSWTASNGALGTTSPKTVTLNGKSWTVTRSSVVYTGWSSNCIQFGSSNGAETVTLSSSAFPGTIKSVYIQCSSYSNAHKVSITVGGTTYLASTATAKWTTVSSKGGTGTSSGEIVITLTKGTRAVYIKSISVTYEEAASCTQNPTLNGAANNGAVSSSSIPVKCSGITAIGSNCSLTSYGFVWAPSSTTTSPTLSNSKHQVGTSIATSTEFSYTITGLNANTSYSIRPYATNGNGTAYGTVYTVSTAAACTAAPTVTAASKGTIASTSAAVTCSSGISSLGTGGCAISSYGFAVGTSSNPTIGGTLTSGGKTYEVGTTYTTTGTSFNTTVTGLTEGTLYYARPYATNGYGTNYGTQVSFGTPKITASQTSRAFGDRAVGGSYTMTFTVSGTYLQGNISIARTAGSTYFTVDKATVTQTDGTAPTTTITVTYAPAAAGSHSATLTLSSTNATSKTVALSGTGKYKVTWMVNGTENSTSLVASGGNPTFPTAPSSCDNTKVFVGWTETNIGSIETNTAPTFITTATTISANKTYYAVFAKRGDFTRVTGPSSLAAGQELVIVSNKYSTAITTGIGYATAPTESSSKVSPTEAMIWLLTGNSTDGWRITKPGNGYLLGVGNLPGNNSSNTATLNSNNTNSTWGIGQNSYTTNVLYISNKTTATCALEASSNSANWVVYNSSSYNSNQYCALKVYASTLSKFVTQCASLSSIAVKTAPDKVVYLAGETFDPTGLVITATYSNSTTVDITYVGNESSFTFNPTTATALTKSNTSVTITYGGKSTTQSITVYGLTLQAKDENNAAIASGGPGSPTFTPATRGISPAADAASYKFWKWEISGASLGKSATTSSNSITSPKGDVTVTAVYYVPRTVTWMVDGVEWKPGDGGGGGTNGTPKVAYGTKWQALTLPTAPTTSDGCGEKFIGWTNTEISGKYVKGDDDAAITTLYNNLLTSDNKSSKTTAINNNIVFHAVFVDYVTE